ncbi:MAG: hypothetical protein R6U63_02570 [Longimicrobiales bacterium]
MLTMVPGGGVAPAAGQDTTRVREGRQAERERTLPDTVLQDTVIVDTVLPPPTTLPPFEAVGGPGWSQGVWEWSREDLLRRPDLSLLHLLERIPGMVPVRADIAGQPEAAALFGAGAGAIRWVLDGFVVDPLTAPTFDPARLSLLALERVRVERGVTGATVHLETLTPEDARTKSVIEAGTGDYGVNAFRGIFLPPRVLGGPLAMGFERLSVNGFTPGASNQTVSWLKWTWARDSAGIQVEYRQRTMEREGVGEGLLGSRSDWVVRARQAVGPVTGEAYAGGTAVEDEVGGEGGTAYREGVAQGGLRLAAAVPGPVPAEVTTALRFRGHPRLPVQELEVAGRVAPLPWLTVQGEALHGRWSDADPTGRWSARAGLGPIRGLQLFGEVFRGGSVLGSGPELAWPAPADTTQGGAGSFRVSRDGLRAGLQFSGAGLTLGGAVVEVAADTIYPFGLPMEGRWGGVAGGEARGFEVSARIPTGFDPLTVQGWYVGMDAPGWLYLPEHHWRAGLVYHHRPLPSGNLEFFARFEHLFRGRMNVPAPAGETTPYVESDAYRATNLELTIRVLTVRAFLRWDNLFHRRDQADLPGFRLPGQRIVWGVKWEFWN